MGYKYAIRQFLERWLESSEEAFQYASYRVLLPYITDSSYKSIAVGVAKFLGCILAMSPLSGRRIFGQFRNGLGSERIEAFVQTCNWFSGPLRSFVVLRRVLKSKENPGLWRIREINREYVDQLRDSGLSYIIATGHFCREATLPMYLKGITPNRIILVSARRQKLEENTYKKRINIQYGQMMDVIEFLRKDDAEIIEFDKQAQFKHIVSALRTPGTTLVLSVDAPWKKNTPGCVTMPFAGRREASFATGAARFAKIAKVPVITCIPYVNDDGDLVVEWKQPIKLSTDGDGYSEERLMNTLLHDIEIAIGNRPSQYVLGIGSERLWSRDKQCWE